MPTHYVSQETLNTVLDLLKENREIIREQVTGIGEKVDALGDQLTDGVNKITTRQDIANGRTDKAEAAIAAMKKEVEQILTEGCDQKHKHAQDVALLRGSGALPVYEEEPPIVRTPIPYMGDASVASSRGEEGGYRRRTGRHRPFASASR